MRKIVILVLAAPVVIGLALLAGASGFGLPDLSTSTGSAIFSLRLLRVINGFAVGAGLACAGAILQALLRNPLAEPYVLGVSSGAGLGAAIAIVTGLAALNVLVLPAAAFVASAVSIIIVFAMARFNGRFSIYSVILSGVIVSAICSSILMFVTSVMPVEGLHSVIWWMLGNLETTSDTLVYVSATIMLLSLLAAWTISNQLNAMTLGREMAHNTGVRTGRIFAIGISIATLMTACAVSASGLIGFIGLIIPHVMRGVVGADHRRLLPFTALAGGLLLVACDAAARTVMAPIEIPTGVITAVIGGPFFIYILRKSRKSNWIEG